jgi:hypothetical protein
MRESLGLLSISAGGIKTFDRRALEYTRSHVLRVMERFIFMCSWTLL